MSPTIQSPEIFQVTSLESLTISEQQAIYRQVDAAGYLIVKEAKASPPQAALASICRLFGAPVQHEMSDPSGIHPVEFINGHPDYANTRNDDLALHTDGSFEQQPPEIMFLYCEHPAREGGVTCLALADDIYRHLSLVDSNLLSGLFKDNAYTAKRDEKTATHPIFRDDSGWLRMVFRAGQAIPITIDEDAQRGVAEIERFLGVESNIVRVKLESNQLLILDNTRVLHGRTAFSRDSGRKLHGLWCRSNDEPSTPFTPGFRADS